MDSLSILLGIPALTALAVLLLKRECHIKIAALTGSIIQLVYAVIVTIQYAQLRAAGSTGTMLFERTISWFKPLNINYHVGVDGISLSMILLTAIVVVGGVLVSWKIAKMVKEFFFLLIFLSLGAYGFFISLDLFTMFFFLELAVIPKYLLIGIWGSGKKEYSAMKLALMLMGGSALVFVGIVGLYLAAGWFGNGNSFNMLEIAQLQIPSSLQAVLYVLLFAGFGVFTAMFPFHTWAPDGHSSAPTAASMFLAGISMKLGGYGALRVATALLPDAAVQYSWIFIIAASVAILYGSFATLMQKDLKFMNAYSSVSHCGFVVLGIAMLTTTAVTGAVMQMVSHGIMTALFFAAIGMIYDRAHTRQADQLGGMLKQMPFIGTAFIIAGLCSLGLPGFSGFVSEMTVFVGSWERTDVFHRVATIMACASIVVTAVYILRAVGLAIWGTVKNKEYESFADASWNERAAAILLIGGVVIIGICPFLLTNLIGSDVATMMERVTKILVL